MSRWNWVRQHPGSTMRPSFIATVPCPPDPHCEGKGTDRILALIVDSRDGWWWRRYVEPYAFGIETTMDEAIAAAEAQP